MKISEFKKFLKENWYSQNKINTLISKIAGLSKEALFMSSEDLDLWDISKTISSIKNHKPFEYIVNSSEFMGIDFYVDERVLIPRDDTSVIVEEALKEDCDFLIDVWTWSWTIPISYLLNVDKETEVIWLDLSNEAIEVSKINRGRHNLSYKIEESDLLSYIFDNVDIINNKEKVLITANLPYIKNWDFGNMDKEVFVHEPDMALYGWTETWFELYEKLILQILELKKIIKTEIILFIEIGFDQKLCSSKILKDLWLKFEYFKDTSKIDRVIKIYFN